MSVFTRPAADLHIHSIASGHAFSTIAEIAAAAARKGLDIVAITDHGPALPGGPHPYHFAALRFVPPVMEGVRILRGIEANIVEEGQLDLEDHLLGRLDLVMAGFHEACGFDGRGEAANTRALLALMETGQARVISHPGNPNFPLDYQEVAKRATETNTALEINNSSFVISRKGSAPNCLALARFCARYGTPVSVASDAHIAQGVGEFDAALAALAEAGVAWEQVVNRSVESTLAFLGLTE